MRLRFRGASWDDSQVPGPSDYPRVPIFIPRSDRPSTPLPPLGDVLQSEGLVLQYPSGAASCWSPRPQETADLAPWPILAIKRACNREDPRQPSPAGLEDCQDLELDSERQGDAKTEPEGSELRGYRHQQVALSTSSAECCVFTSDPTLEVVPEPSFLQILLSVDSWRANFFTASQIAPFDVRQALPLLTAMPGAKRPLYGRPATTVGCGFGDRQALRELLKYVHRATDSPRGDGVPSPTPVAVAPEGSQQHRFEPITIEMDEEAHVQLEGIPSDRNGTHLCEGVGISTANLRAQNGRDVDRNNSTNGVFSVPEPAWSALGVSHVMKERPVKSPLQSTADATLYPSSSTYAEPPPIHILPVLKAGFGLDPVLPRVEVGQGSDHSSGQTDGDISNLAGGNKCGGFMRIHIEESGRERDLQLHDSLRCKGFFSCLGSLRGELQIGEIPWPNCDQLPGQGNHMGFDPNSPSPLIGPRSSFPERFPRIPTVAIAGRGRHNLTQQGQATFKLGINGDNESWRKDTRPHSLAPLWTALHKAGGVGPCHSSSKSLLWNSAPHFDLGMLMRQRGSLFGDLSLLPPGHARDTREAISNATDKLLAEILASWRKTHGHNRPADRRKRPEPEICRPPATPHTLSETRVPSQAPQAQHSDPPSSQAPPLLFDAEAVSSAKLPSQLDSTSSGVQESGKGAIDVARNPHTLPAYEGADQGCGPASPVSRPPFKCTSMSREEKERASPQCLGREVLGSEKLQVELQRMEVGALQEGEVDNSSPRQATEEPTAGKVQNEKTFDEFRQPVTLNSGIRSGGVPEESTPRDDGTRFRTVEAREAPPSRPLAELRRPEREVGSTSHESTYPLKGQLLAETSPQPARRELPLPPSKLVVGTQKHLAPASGNGLLAPLHDATDSRVFREQQAGTVPQRNDEGASDGATRSSRPRMASTTSPITNPNTTTGQTKATPLDEEGGPLDQASTDRDRGSVRDEEEVVRGVVKAAASKMIVAKAGAPEKMAAKSEASIPTAVGHERQHSHQQAETKGAEQAEDTAMAGCQSSRQREMLALLRAGAEGAAFLLSRGLAASGCAPGSKPLRHVSESRGASTPFGVSAPSAQRGYMGHASQVARGGSNDKQVGRKAQQSLYAIVSENFIDRAGKLVLALSNTQGAPPTAVQPAALQSAPNAGPAMRQDSRVALLELSVEPPVDLVVGSRSAVVILDSRCVTIASGGEPGGGAFPVGDSSTPGSSAGDVEVAEAKEKLRLLTLQTLKYSTLWLIMRIDKPRGGEAAGRREPRLSPALEKLEQWLVDFPCRVLIRYSNSEAQLVELITHAALAEQQESVSTVTTTSASAPGVQKRRRLNALPREGPSLPGRSPLEAVEEYSRNDPDWALVHHRQAWFLQLFPSLNAYSASALLSATSLKHLIVAPYEELAPALLGRGGREGNGGGAGAARGGVSAESLRDFCSAIRLEGGGEERERGCDGNGV